jgi:carbonic anhydrase
MIPADAALQRLREGNARYVAGKPDVTALDHRKRRERTAGEQHPFAAILACSDSRVPVEIVFDQGIGDLFVVRIPGNVVGLSQAASIEFAANHLGVRLVVVLGHTNCGAVAVAVDGFRHPAGETSPDLGFFIDKIRPSVERAITGGHGQDTDRLVEEVVRENIRRSAATLQNDSAGIRSLVEDDGLQVVGAEYSLQTGIVEYL